LIAYETSWRSATPSGMPTPRSSASYIEKQSEHTIIFKLLNMLAYLISASQTSFVAVQGNVNKSKTFIQLKDLTFKLLESLQA